MVQGHWKAARRAWAWSEKAYGSGHGRLHRLKRHLRWALSAVLRQRRANAWFSFLDEPGLEAFLWVQPRLVFRPFGQYLALGWSWADRVKVLQDTYRFLRERGGPLREGLSRTEGVLLAELDVERGQRARIRIHSDPKFRKEGELGIFLELEGIPGTVSGFAFSLRQEADGGWVGLIGAIQGRKDGEEVIRLATKALQGMRPLLIFLAQEIAAALGLKALYGVGNQRQVYRAPRRSPFAKRRPILLDYDLYWEEAGAEPTGDGWFRIPLSTPRRDLADIKPNKRSQHAKRYRMLDELGARIREGLAGA